MVLVCSLVDSEGEKKVVSWLKRSTLSSRFLGLSFMSGMSSCGSVRSGEAEMTLRSSGFSLFCSSQHQIPSITPVWECTLFSFSLHCHCHPCNVGTFYILTVTKTAVTFAPTCSISASSVIFLFQFVLHSVTNPIFVKRNSCCCPI